LYLDFHMEFLNLVDILGIVAFSISGVIAAMEKRLDMFGVFIIAFITALGGGTLRDILIGDTPVSWMRNPVYGLIVFASVVIGIVAASGVKKLQKPLLLFDSLGLGFFTILGLEKGVALGLHPAICIALGTITACFGGVTRDITLNTIPLIFHKEIYATACIFGGVLYFLLLKTNLSIVPLNLICMAAIFIVRLIAVRYNWSLPDIYGKAKE
jgi:uncharacterized membrane protein YeiH